ncbi:MAG: LD-carboxypeptidase [Blastocatellia bacterium]
MNRRTFTTSLGAVTTAPLFSGASGQQRLSLTPIRPRRLKPGDTVGVITPSTPLTNPDRLALVERTLKHFGLRAKWGKNVGRRAGYFGSAPDERLDDLHAMFRDPEVSAVYPIQGGYGAMHLLDRIDYDLIRRNPKVLVGYSDITALHLAIQRMTGLITFHGPNVMERYTDYTQQHYRRALFETAAPGVVTNPPDSDPLRPVHSLRAIRPGQATGRLTGGNLTLISTLMGTPWEIDTRGAILLLEDVGEEPYRIDRMLTQLRLAGKLEQAAGIVFGECSQCAANEFRPSLGSNFSLGEVLDAMLGSLKIPVLFGLTFGHTADQLTLPLGVNATLDAGRGTLDIKEAGVV